MTDMEAKYQNQVPTMAVYNVQADCYEEIDKSRLATPATHSYNWDSYYASTTSPNLSDGVSLVYSSPKSTASDAPAPTSQEQETPEKNTDRASSAPPKRKRENRYKDAPPSVLSRRRAQNRASQRAYRERKEQRIRDLEKLLDEAHRRHDALTQAYVALRTEMESMRAGQHQHSHQHQHQHQQPLSSPDPHRSVHHQQSLLLVPQQQHPHQPQQQQQTYSSIQVQPLISLGLAATGGTASGLEYVLPVTQAGTSSMMAAAAAAGLYSPHPLSPF
jgi:hypothetical protein